MDSKLPIALAFTALTVMLSSNAMAKDTGFYIGASIGGATVDAKEFDAGDIDFSSTDFAYKILAGYQFNGILAVEGGYRDFGSPKDNGVKIDPDGWDIYGVAGLPLGPIRLFGKLGGIAWETKSRFGDLSEKDDGFDLGAGVGLEFELFGLGLRGEVEYFDMLGDTWMYTLGGTFTF